MWGVEQAWLSGFTGSAGESNSYRFYTLPLLTCSCCRNCCCAREGGLVRPAASPSAGPAVDRYSTDRLFTDGRYHLQASQELCPAWTLHKHGLPDVKSWQEQLANLPSGSRIGLDPSLISIGDYNTIVPTLSKNSALVPISKNLVDEIWADKPKRPAEPIVVHEKHAGKSMQDKLEEIRKELRKKKENWGMVIALLDEICCEYCLRSRFGVGTDSLVSFQGL